MRVVPAARRVGQEPAHEVYVQIHQVDLTSGSVIGKDSTGGRIRIDIRSRAKGSGVPDPGETWRVRRRGSSWTLVDQYDAKPPLDASAGQPVDTMSVLRDAGLVSGIVIDNKPTIMQWKIHLSTGEPITGAVLTDTWLSSALRSRTWTDELQSILRTYEGGESVLPGAYVPVGTPVISYLPEEMLTRAVGKWGARGEVVVVGRHMAALNGTIPDWATKVSVLASGTNTRVKVTTKVGTAAETTGYISATGSGVTVSVGPGTGARTFAVSAETPGTTSVVEIRRVRFIREADDAGPSRVWIDIFGQHASSAKGFAHEDNPLWAGGHTLSILALGSREAFEGYPAMAFKQDMAKILDRYQERSSLAVLVVPPRPWEVSAESWGEYRTAIYECARDYKVGLFDLGQAWPEYSLTSLGLRNGSELSEYGHRFVANFIAESLSQRS